MAALAAASAGLRAAQLLMLQGRIAVPLAMAESIRLALDWPAQVCTAFVLHVYISWHMYCQFTVFFSYCCVWSAMFMLMY